MNTLIPRFKNLSQAKQLEIFFFGYSPVPPSAAQYSQVQPKPEPDPKPELFGQTRPEVKKPYSSGLGHGGLEAGDSKIDPLGWA